MASSPAQRQTAANEDVDRLARALYENERNILQERHSAGRSRIVRATWELATEERRTFFVEFARRALVNDLVRIGKGVPEAPPRQMEGQQQLLVDTPDGTMDANTGEMQ